MNEILKFFSYLVLIVVLISGFLGIYFNGMILFGDTDLRFHFSQIFFSFNNVYVWNDLFQSGSFDWNQFQGFFLKKLIFIIGLALNNLYLFSYFYFFLSYFFYIITFYFLIKTIAEISESDRNPNTIAFVLSFCALFNGIFIIYAGQILFILALIMLNVFLIFFIKNIAYINLYHKNNTLYLIIMSLAIAEVNIYMQVLFLLIYALFFLGILHIKYIYKYIWVFLTQIIVVGIISTLLSASWILALVPQFFIAQHPFRELIQYDVDLGWKQLQFISPNVYLSELFRLKSYHVFNAVPSMLYFLSIVPVAIIILELKNKKNYLWLSVFLLILFSIFLSYGTHTFTQPIYAVLWKYVPFFNTFRTHMKFSYILLYGVFILLTLVLSKQKKIKTFYIYLALLALNAFFSLFYFHQAEFKGTMRQYKIPDYYFEIQKYSNEQKNTRIGSSMLLPQINWLTQYDWAPKKIDSMNILPFFIENNSLVNSAQYTPDTQYLYNTYYNNLFRNSSLDELKKLTLYRNIGQIIYQDDIRFSNDETENKLNKPRLTKMLALLSNKTLCQGVKQFGRLYVCKVSDVSFTPLISASQSPVLVKKQPFIDLQQENPIVLTDLAMLDITTRHNAVFFETYLKEFSHSESMPQVFLTMRPYVTQDCYDNGLPCNIYFGTNIPSGNYGIYYRHYPVPGSRKPKQTTFKLEFYDGVNNNYIKNSVQNFTYGTSVQLPSNYRDLQTILLTGLKGTVYLGTLQTTGNNIVIRTNNNDYFSNGRFYLVKQSSAQKGKYQQLPVVTFKKINPTKFDVTVEKAQKNFILNFAENFHRGWKLYTLSRNNSKKAIEAENHIKNYGYANTWVIDVSTLCDNGLCIKNSDGTYTIHFIIDFMPQQSTFIGIVISFITFGGCMVYVLWHLVRKMREEHA